MCNSLKFIGFMVRLSDFFEHCEKWDVASLCICIPILPITWVLATVRMMGHFMQLNCNCVILEMPEWKGEGGGHEYSMGLALLGKILAGNHASLFPKKWWIPVFFPSTNSAGVAWIWPATNRNVTRTHYQLNCKNWKHTCKFTIVIKLMYLFTNNGFKHQILDRTTTCNHIVIDDRRLR